jgi:hypothetical protein
MDEAQTHAVTLVIDQVKVDVGSGFRLLGVTATTADVPGARLAAPEVDVETKWLKPSKVIAKGIELTLAGRWSTVAAALDAWLSGSRGLHGPGWTSVAPLITDGSRIVWVGPVGENARVEAAGVHADISWPDSGGAVLHASSDNVRVTVPSGVLGPWRLDVDRGSASTRVCVGLDPGVPNSCTVLVVGNAEATTDVQVALPRSPIARLGIPARLLGVAGHDLQIDANIHYAALGAARADVTAKGGLHGIESRGIPRPFDVAWDATAGGDPRSGIDVKQARLAVGPLVGNVRGMLKRLEGRRGPMRRFRSSAESEPALRHRLRASKARAEHRDGEGLGQRERRGDVRVRLARPRGHFGHLFSRGQMPSDDVRRALTAPSHSR